jgi:hypothetical protein
MKHTCKFCGKEFSKGKELFHINNKCRLTGNDKLHTFCSFVYGDDIVNGVIEMYVNGYSIDELKKYGFSRKMLVELLTEQHIEVRGVSASMQSDIRNLKYVDTCTAKYGVSNISKLDSIKRKKADTFMNHYGVDNVRKCDDFRVNHGYNETMMNKYGKLSTPNKYGNMNEWWSTLSVDERKLHCKSAWTKSSEHWHGLSEYEKIKIIHKRLDTLVQNYPNGVNRYSSSLERRISSILDNNNIVYKSQYWVNRRSYDFKFDNNILLEVNGDYWHANPILYNADDILHGDRTAQSIWDEDAIKKKNAEKYSYRLVVLWEYDINGMSDTDILEFIQAITATPSDL